MPRADNPELSAATNLRESNAHRAASWYAALIIALAFVLAAALSWRKWPDVLIDFGLQLYLPWKISTGSVLYRDVMYLTAGPLSQYYHALLFKIFGVSFRTVIFSNLLLTAGLLVLLFRRFRAATNLLTATLVCLAIVLVFAFNQYGEIGNYNFIAPYCHEAVHGVLLSILAIAFLSDWQTRERMGFALAAGLCAGLVFLTKPEVFAALAMTIIGAFVLFAATKGRGRFGFAFRSLGVLVGAGTLPFIAFLLYFHRYEDWPASLHSAGFAWVPLFHGGVANGHYYRWCLGLDTPALHIVAMLKQLLCILAGALLFTFVFRRKMDAMINRLLAFGAVGIVFAGASAFTWTDCGRTLPLLDLIFCILVCANYRRLSADKPVAFLLLWSIFGLFLTAKLGLFCRIWHYGFILAMPAFISTVALLIWLLPQILARKFGVNQRLFRAAVTLVFLAGFVQLFIQSQLIYRDKTIAVGHGADLMFAPIPKDNHSPVGAALQSGLPWLEQNTPQDATLAVLPEGVMANYLSRRTNPTRFLVWNPVELAMFGQGQMTEVFERNAPDYIMLIHRDGSEYGVKFFGQQPEFGLGLMEWIRQNYDQVYLLGKEPLQTSSFGISILKRHSQPALVNQK